MSPPDALREALGQVIFDQRREWRREREVIEAQSRQVIAELRAQIVEMQAELRAKVDARLAEVRNGEPGERGEAGPQGDAGTPGERGEKGDIGERGMQGEPGINGTAGEAGPQGEVGERGERGEAGTDGERGENGDPGKDGAAGRDGIDGKDFDLSEIAALRSAIEDTRSALSDLHAVKADSDLSDREFERRVDASLAESDHIALEAVRDAVVGAMREAPRSTINVSVPVTMPRRGKEIMTVEHDAKGRIKRSVKQEVD